MIHTQIELDFTCKIPMESHGNKYNVFIRYPDDYNNSNKSYPVIFLLDPNYLFNAIYGIDAISHKYIIVGIGHEGINQSNVDFFRPRDFLPFKLDNIMFRKGTDEKLIKDIQDASGYAEKFAPFIIDQVLPLVEQEFRVTDERIFIGHSFGGVFACYMMFYHSEIFNKIIAISPIIDSRYYVQKEMFQGLSPTSVAHLYCSLSSLEEEGEISTSCKKLLESKNIGGKFEIFENLDHVSVVLPSIISGIKFLEEKMYEK